MAFATFAARRQLFKRHAVRRTAGRTHNEQWRGNAVRQGGIPSTLWGMARRGRSVPRSLSSFHARDGFARFAPCLLMFFERWVAAIVPALAAATVAAHRDSPD
jgi:hypothetical protein